MADVTPPPFQDLDVPKDVYQTMLVKKDTFEGSRIDLPWHMYTPEQAADNGDELYPLVISLHGGYGREVEDGHILVDGAPFMLGSSNGLLTEENRAKYPTYIMIPHCRQSADCSFYSNEWSSNGGAFYTVANEPSKYGSALIELIEHVIENYQVDPARIYVTGVSMGGGGTWELAQRRPDLVAAAFPQAGHTPALQFLDKLAESKVPVWAFSSSNDNVNSHRDTDQAVQHISERGGCAWVTKYDGYEHGHLLWQRAFLEPGLWPWIFSQKQPREGEASASPATALYSADASSGVGADAASGPSLLSDGTFATGPDGFVATLTDESVSWDGEADFYLEAASNDAELVHPVSLQGGNVYTLCFDAKSSEADRSIAVGLDTGAPNQASLTGGDTKVDITTAYQSYSTTFTAAMTDATAWVRFRLGANDADVQLDNVGLYEGRSCGNLSE